jgi:hypothetical protein
MNSESRQAVQELVALGRQQFTLTLGNTGQRFEDAVWDVTSLLTRITKRHHARLYFTCHGSQNEPLPGFYGDVVKSWLLLERGAAATMRNRLMAVRVLWDALQQRRTGIAADFLWETVCEEDLRQTDLLMQKYWALSTAHKRGACLLSLVRFLAARGICPPLYYVLQTPRPRDFNNHTLAGQEARRAKLPSSRTLDGLADIYNKLAVEPQDRLLAAAVALLVVTGLRVGELLTLPEACEVLEKGGDKEVYGIRYYKEKSRGGARLFAVRWLTPIQAELAQVAVAEIRQLTAAVREQARVLEENPDHIVLPGVEGRQWLTVPEAQAFLGGCSRDRVNQLVRRGELVDGRWNGGRAIEVQSLATHLYSRRCHFLWTVDHGDGTYQLLSETLLVASRHCFHSTKCTSPLLVEPLSINQINDFLRGRGETKSVFERFDIREEDGSYCRITSHQLRHWLNDVADKGGLPIDVLTRWMSRDYPRDTEAYRHATVDERLEWVRRGIRQHALDGTVASVYFALPETEREAFLEGQVQAVHFTPMGLCLHDFAVEPCPYHLNCLRGCPDYLRTKGSRRERQHLLQIRENTVQALAYARQQVQEGRQNLGQAWVAHHEATLQGLEAALALDGDVDVPDGAFVPLQMISSPASRLEVDGG